MKKTLILFVGIISFLGINTVKADTFTSSTIFDNFDSYVNDYLTYKENVDYLINYWKENYSIQYPYYGIIEYPNGTIVGEDKPVYILYYTDNNKITFNSLNYLTLNINYNNEKYNAISYNKNTDSYDYSGTSVVPYIYGGSSIKGFKLLLSNGLIFDSSDSEFDTITFPSYVSESLNVIIDTFNISTGNIIPSILSLYDGSYDTGTSNYIEVNLNDYPYVILSLKDYTPRDTFTSTMFVKGQLCATTLYNYGLAEKKDYVSGYQTQNCSYYYNDFMAFDTYIKSEDIKNHSVYYLSAYDFTKPNLVKFDNSVYDITYITEDTKDDPYVSINGKNYPSLPYNSLTDSAILTEKYGVSNTWTCAKYDPNCNLNTTNINFKDLFDKPLEILKDIFTSISRIFNIITEFISLLPEQLQSSLYLSFVLALILGLIKIIL